MNLKTISEFHWITKAVIILTAIILLLLLLTLAAAALGLVTLSSFSGMFLMSFTSMMVWLLFPVIVIIIIISIIVTKIKAWIEKYLDAILAKIDLMGEVKSSVERSDAKLAVIGGKIEDIENKVDNIERILKNVSE